MKDKIIRYCLISVGILSLVILLVIFARYILPVISPFLIAGIIAALTVSPASKLAEKIKAPPKIIRLILSLLLTLLFFSTIAFVIWWVSTSVWSFLVDFNKGNRLYDMLSSLLSSENPVFGELFSSELASRISDAIDGLVSGALTNVVEGITSFAAKIPQLLFFLLVTLISLVYFAVDYDRITALLLSILPKKITRYLRKLRIVTLTVVKKYFCSYLLIMLITYCTVLVGFLLLRVKHAPTLALFVAMLDMLPVIGVGTILIPWGIFEIASGNRILGIGLIMLFVANAIIRQMSEPRIVGKSLNMHPLITLMAIYVGYALFGIVGIFVLPMVAVCFSALLNGDDSTKIA